MKHEKEKFYVYFQSHVHDEGDSVAEVDQETFERVSPWRQQLVGGQDHLVPDDVNDLVWSQIRPKVDDDLRPSELKEFDQAKNVVWVAVC